MSARVQSLELHREEGAEDQRRPVRMVYSQAPFLIYWELTRACDLACRHCRAEAMAQRDPRELSTSEGKGLLEKLREFGGRGPHLVLTGGDPLKRPDLFDLLEYGRRLGLDMAVSPSGTQALTPEVLLRFEACGAEGIGRGLAVSTG